MLIGDLDLASPLSRRDPPNHGEHEPPRTPDEAMATLAQLATALAGAYLAGSGFQPFPARQDESAESSDRRLQWAEARFRALIEQIPAVTFMAALDGGPNELYVSPQIEALLGYTQEEWVKDPVLWFRRLHPDDRALWSDEFARGCATGGPFRAECRFLARNGSIVWVRGEARVERDAHGRPLFLQGLAYDITESKRAEGLIKASLREKETLLKEIHHRVKNNLQITSSLLKLQSSRTRDEASRVALVESQGRIRAIALVHEMLYRSADLSFIDMAEYLHRLIDQIARTHGKPQRIAVTMEFEELRVAIDKAVPCGLLISELVGNAFKHAFPDERAGTILVRFNATNGELGIDVNDDGIGFPPGADLATWGSLGLQLVRALTSQIHGKLDIASSEAGTTIHIALPSDVARLQERA